MKDSFNNEIQVGDRILCIDTGIYTSHRINQIGTIAKIYYNRIIVNFDLADNRDLGYSELNVPSNHGNCLILDQDIFVKIETHTEVEYRVGDKVLCYCAIDNDHPFVGTVTQESNNELCKIADELGINHILTKTEILFLLERTQYKVGDEIIVQNSSNFEQSFNFELLFGEGINLNDEDNWKKRGIAIYKQDKEIAGYNKKENKNQVSYRSFLFADLEIPIFSENFFKDINII